MKALAILAALIAAIAFGSTAQAETVQESPIPDLTNEASHDLSVRVEGPGGTLSSPSGFSPDICFVNDAGEVECLFTLRREAPPVGYRLFWDGVYFLHVDGDAWCNLQVRQGDRYAATPGCVWGHGFVYTLSVKIGVAGDYEATYTHEQQEWYLGDGKFGPDSGQHLTVLIDKDCREAVRKWRDEGMEGRPPLCRSHTWLKENVKPLVPVD